MRYPREPLYKEFYDRQKVDPQVQISHLLDYLEVVPHLTPPEGSLNEPTIRHVDLSPNNIFVSDSGDITGIIDWQYTTVLPLFLQAKIPKHFQNHGDDDSDNFRPPKLADDYNILTPERQEIEMESYRRRQVHYFYLGFTSHINEAHYNAMTRYSLIARNQLYDVACRPWEGDNTSLQAAIINTLAHWSAIVPQEDESVILPIDISQSDSAKCLEIDAKQRKADAQMQHIRDHIGINIEGWMPTEHFESAKDKAQQLKAQMLESADTEEERAEVIVDWPFQDHEEVDG